MNPAERRAVETASMLLIGEGVLALCRPQAHCRLWRGRDGAWSTFIDWFIERPNVVRALAASEIGAGCWLAFRQERRSDVPSSSLSQEQG